MRGLKIKKIEIASGVILWCHHAREAFKRMRVKDGDSIPLTESPDGTYRITPFDPEFKNQMDLANDVMSRFRNTLRELSK